MPEPRKPGHVFPVEKIHRLDDPARDDWQQPDRVVEALGLKPGMAVADIGAGSGYFTFRLAHAVEEKGRVYAADVQQEMLDIIVKRGKGLSNITPVLSAHDDSLLPARSVDVVLIVNTYHEIQEPEAYMKNLRAALRPEGTVFIIDWHPDSPEGPPADHRVPPDVLEAEMDRAGYRPGPPGPALKYQYFLRFHPK